MSIQFEIQFISSSKIPPEDEEDDNPLLEQQLEIDFDNLDAVQSKKVPASDGRYH